MNKRLFEFIKPITAISRLEPGNNEDTDSRGIPLTIYRKALVRCRLGAQVEADTDVTCQVREADNAAGATSRNIGDGAATPQHVFARVAGGLPANANIVSIRMAAPAAGREVIVNGVTFAAVNGPTVLADGEWDMRGGNDDDAVEFAACVNHLLPDLLATPDGTDTVTIESRDPGATTITVTGVTDITDTVPTLIEGVAYFEVDPSSLSDGYEYIVVRISTSGTSNDAEVDADVILGDGRYNPPAQQAAGSAFS